MVFSSIFFVFCFLPLFMLAYYLIPRKYRDVVLFLGSILFYAWGSPVYTVLMLFSAFFNYFMALDLEAGVTTAEKKRSLVFALLINVGILCFFKYYGFLLDTIGGIFSVRIGHPQLALPMGISFYTFKNLSYIVDVYKKRVPAQKSFLTFGVYSTMFPHMSAGPIVRYADIQRQLKKRSLSMAKLGVGVEYFVKGLAKKIILADNLALIYQAVNSAAKTPAVVTAWIGILAYSLQIYLDFSGYSDMAIGLGKMLGFDFAKNFDYPYLSRSVSEFWRRWHISLGSWFRDYIYIPLGGNRVSNPKFIRNILIVWALTGLWHGASWNFVLWGVYYGLLLLLEKFFLKNFLKNAPVILTRIYTLLAVIIGWVFFSQVTFGAIFHYLGTMVGIGASGFINSETLYFLRTGGILLVLGILTCSPRPQMRFRRMMRRHPNAAVLTDLFLMVLAIAYMVYNSYSTFLYQQF